MCALCASALSRYSRRATDYRSVYGQRYAAAVSADGVNFDKLVRCLIGVALFSSAYMAEVVRGGLQAIPKGQYEAAVALGLGYWKTTRLIILPQALKLVIPGIVNTFIGLFKDTTLVLIVGLFDLLGIVQLHFTDATDAGNPYHRLCVCRGRVLAFLFCHVALFNLYGKPSFNRQDKLMSDLVIRINKMNKWFGNFHAA